jgi:hypothetical protein
MVLAGVLTVVSVAAIAPAGANAANPNPDTTGTATVNADGTVTAHVSGTWIFPGQNCAGRYGQGYAVDWWGISTSKTPNPTFSLTNASIVTGPGVTTTGTVSPAGAIAIKNTSPVQYFHVGQYYAGESVNSSSTCTDYTANGKTGSTGSWSAVATYPSRSVMPPQVCVNMYDEHGKEGQPSTSSKDYSPVLDTDNSIQTNAFNPASGAGYCVEFKFTPTGYVEVCKAAASEGVTGNFQFTFNGKTYTVPVGACTSAIKVPSGPLTITEVARTGYKLVGVSAAPARRLVSVDLSTRTAVVTISTGGRASQTIATFTNDVA